MIVLFPRHGDAHFSSKSDKLSSTRRGNFPTNLGSKLQRLAHEDPAALRVIEEVVDRWLADAEAP